MTIREQPDPGDGWRLASGDDWKDARCQIWCRHNERWNDRSSVMMCQTFSPPDTYRIPIDSPQPVAEIDNSGTYGKDGMSYGKPTHHGGDHYQSLAIQPWDYSTANRLEYNEGVVVAYVTRWRSKGGVEDLQKAIDHINKLIEFETKEATK